MKKFEEMTLPELEKAHLESHRNLIATDYFIRDFIEKAVKEVLDIEINNTNINTQLYSEQEENDSVGHIVEIPIEDFSTLTISNLVDFAKKVNKFPDEISVKVSDGNLYLSWYSSFWEAPEIK